MTELARINFSDGVLVIADADSDRLLIDEPVNTTFRGPTGNEWIKSTAGTAETDWVATKSLGSIKTASASEGNQKLHLARFLDTNGDGTGTKNANGDYSVTPDIFYIQPGAGEIFRIARIIISIEDTTAMQAQEYGNLGAALTNGITMRKQDDSGTLVDYCDGMPVKTNAAWGTFCYDADLKSWGAGNELLLVRWTFSKYGQFLRLDGDENERLEIVVSDDLDGLINHNFIAEGYVES